MIGVVTRMKRSHAIRPSIRDSCANRVGDSNVADSDTARLVVYELELFDLPEKWDHEMERRLAARGNA